MNVSQKHLTLRETLSLCGLLAELLAKILLLGLWGGVLRIFGALGWLSIQLGHLLWKYGWMILDELDDAFRCCKEADPPAIQLDGQDTLSDHEQV